MNIVLAPHELAVASPLVIRPVEPQPTWIENSARWLWWLPKHVVKANSCDFVCTASREWHEYLLDDQKPHKPGDVVGVLEDWACSISYDDYPCDKLTRPAADPLQYRSGGGMENGRFVEQTCFDADGELGNWRPASTLPDWAIRRRLRVVSVECRKIETVTADEAVRAGILDGGCLNCGRESCPHPCGCDEPLPDHRDAFLHHWIITHDAATWAWFVKTGEVSG